MPEVFTSAGDMRGASAMMGINRLIVPVDLSLAAWNTVATHKLFNIAGFVRIVTVICGRTLCSGAAGCLISFGISGFPANMSAAQVVATIGPGIMMGSAAGSSRLISWTDVFASGKYFDLFAQGGVGGTDRHIGFELTVAAALGGTFDAVAFWTPITADGLVTAGTGGAL
jgi:hypothetical protein